MATLGAIFKQLREERRLSQTELGKIVSTSNQWISEIERGNRQPSLDLVADIHRALQAYDGSRTTPSLAYLMMKWLEEEALSIKNIDRKDIDSISQLVVEKFEGRQNIPASLTLRNFPDAFYPLTIVLGDRREPTPVTRGDILANSLAATDVMYLPQLKLDTSVKIKSDKLFVLYDEHDLRDMFGNTNLLILGSPAVNFAARIINKGSLFRFNLTEKALKWEEYVKLIRVLDEPSKVELFWRLSLGTEWRNTDERESAVSKIARENDLPEERASEIYQIVLEILGKGRPQDLMNEFRKPGFLDLADGRVHAGSTKQHNDFGVISLAVNPFSSNVHPDSPPYIAIMAGGIHGPGTAQALRMLAEPQLFEDHPFGGVIEVIIDVLRDWPTRFETAKARWQTRPYTAEQFKARVGTLLEHRPEELRELKDADLQACLDLISILDSPIRSRISPNG